MNAVPEDPPVVILKTQPYPLHSGTIGAVRSVGRLGVAVHVFGEQPGCPVARSRFVRSVRPLPSDDVEPDELVNWLVDSAPPGRPVLIPMDDVGAILVSEWSSALLQRYRFPQLPDGLAATVSDKVGLARLAVKAGVPTPASSAPETSAELEDVVAATTFPVVVKARDPRMLRHTPGVRSVEIAQDMESLRRLWHAHLVEGRSNCLLQEYIPGGPDTVWMVNAYVDETSSMHLAASGRKVRQRPAYTGATTLGTCQRNDEVLALTAQLIRAIGYRGVLDIGWRYDARDGLYKVLDLNPRVGATFRLFAAPDGADVVQALYADLTGRRLPAGQAREGRRWVSELHDLSVARRYIRDGVTTPLGYLRSWRGVAEGAWFATDDLMPAVAAVRAGFAGRRRRLRASRASELAEGPSARP